MASQGRVIDAEPLPAMMSAQETELVALMFAIPLGKGKGVNICRESWHAFEVCHAIGTLCKGQGFVTLTREGTIQWRINI